MTAPLTEEFANVPETTVSSGGTDAPAAGTVQTWHVASSSSFPGVTAFDGTQFHVADTALTSEKIAVTDISGTTWTVTRGAEGTTPVAHSSGFTIQQVITEGWLNTVTVQGQRSQQDLATQRAQALTPWFAGLANRQAARCSVVAIGDSITEGQHAAGPPATGFQDRWIARLRDNLRGIYPTPFMAGGGQGFIGVKSTGETSFTWPVTVSGTVATAATLGPKSSFIQFNAPSGETAAVTLACTSFDVMWTQVFGGGTMTVAVDGTTVGTITTSGGATVDGKTTRFTVASPGTHSVVIAAAGGNADLAGVVEYYGDENQGLQVHDAGHFGWTAANWVTVTSNGTQGPAGAIAALSPSLIIISLGVNDQFANVTPATFQGNLQSLIGNLQAVLPAPLPAVVLNMYPPRVSQGSYTYPWSQYVQAAWNVALNDTSGPGTTSITTVMDFTQGPRMPGADDDAYSLWQSGDTVHPTNKGHQMIGDYVARFLTGA